MIALLLAFLLAAGTRATSAQQAKTAAPATDSASNTGDAARLGSVKQLYDAGRWNDVVEAVPDPAPGAADFDFYRGMALAKLGRWSQARAALRAGMEKAPRDERFPVELAGVEYRLKNYTAAKRDLNRALRIAPRDPYALNFLGTIYLMRGNLAAALAKWNRAGLPRVNRIEAEPKPRVKPELLERAFTFSRLSTLELPDFETTNARLHGLGLFSFERWELRPASGDSFDAVFHSAERDGWGGNKWIALASALRGLPYETVYPAYGNAWGEAVNFDALFRWDGQKRRVFASMSAPLEGDPKWRLRAYADARDENWNIGRTFDGASAPVNDLKLRRLETGVSVESIESGRWSWRTGARFARRAFANFGTVNAAAPFFAGGNALEYTAGTNYEFLFVPGNRLTATVEASAAAGRAFAPLLGAYGRMQDSAAVHWYPEQQGDDYEMRSQIRAGESFGRVPLDELFTLGVERDGNDLWLRGIPATHDGRKGNSPMGRNYVLWNWEDDKIVHQGDFFEVRVGPFLDAGRISDPSGFFGSRGWLWDPGVQLELRVLGAVSVALSYGHDMRSGQNTFFATTGR